MHLEHWFIKKINLDMGKYRRKLLHGFVVAAFVCHYAIKYHGQLFLLEKANNIDINQCDLMGLIMKFNKMLHATTENRWKKHTANQCGKKKIFNYKVMLKMIKYNEIYSNIFRFF